mgnify:CR=1 FL=1
MKELTIGKNDAGQRIDKYMQKLGEYEKIFGFKPSYYEVKPSGGAKILEDF